MFILAFFAGSATAQADRKAAWAEIDRLIKEQKVETAYERLDALLPAIRETAEPKELTRALIRGAQLRAAAVEPAEAVRFLQGQQWPEDRRQRAVLHVFYAKALENYYGEYRWDIWKRESIRSEEPVDVEKWTTGEIFKAASQAYLDAWKEREVLGEIPVTELAEFLEPNNYPKEVRGTLRDMTSYLWVDLLTDTGWWSPAQSNATDRFDLLAMSRNEETVELVELQLADREIHPLVRAMMVLSDLAHWHASTGNKDGALEAGWSVSGSFAAMLTYPR